jgi:hypothetical protein
MAAAQPYRHVRLPALSCGAADKLTRHSANAPRLLQRTRSDRPTRIRDHEPRDYLIGSPTLMRSEFSVLLSATARNADDRADQRKVFLAAQLQMGGRCLLLLLGRGGVRTRVTYRAA